jgi:hypothetical protein
MPAARRFPPPWTIDQLPFISPVGEASDSRNFETLLDIGPDINPRAALGDKGYDSKSNRVAARQRGICPAIPYRSNTRVAKINNDAEQINCVVEVVAFGSYISDTNDLGDIDLVVYRHGQSKPFRSARQALGIEGRRWRLLRRAG